MSSDSHSVSTSSSDSGSGQSGGEGSGQLGGEGIILMEITVESREDPLEELAKNSLPAKARYGWVAEDVRTQYSLFRWSRLLKS